MSFELSPVDEVLFTIGDIAVSRYWVVTPTGTIPISGTRWICRDQTHMQRVMPGYAVILAVIFMFACFLGLLFLAIREDVMTGSVEITVTGPDGFFHVTQVQARGIAQVQQLQQAAARAQHLASL